MGGDYHCRDTEIGDEMLEEIINEIPIKDTPVSESFEQYKSCINQETTGSGDKRVDLDYAKLCGLLFPREKSKYRAQQMEYFDNVWRSDEGTQVLGELIILLSKGGKISHIKYSCELYELFYQNLDKNNLWKLVRGVVQSMSELALISFGTGLPTKENKKMSQMYSISRQKALTDYIMSNYDSLFEKEFKGKTPQPGELKMKNKNIKDLLKRFYELIYSNLNGNYIRNWLSEEYLKEKPKLINPCDFCGE